MVVLAVLAAISVLIEFASLSAVTASSCILAVVTAPLAIVAVVTVPALGVFRFTVDPIVMMKKKAIRSLIEHLYLPSADYNRNQ